MQWVGSYVLRVITWVGSCVRGSFHGRGHVWGHPSDNAATHSGKGSICSKLFVRQGFCGWPGRVNPNFMSFVVVANGMFSYYVFSLYDAESCRMGRWEGKDLDRASGKSLGKVPKGLFRDLFQDVPSGRPEAGGPGSFQTFLGFRARTSETTLFCLDMGHRNCHGFLVTFKHCTTLCSSCWHDISANLLARGFGKELHTYFSHSYTIEMVGT